LPGAERIHGTLVAKGRDGVLLRGASGAGKSDLALRMMAPPRSWRLVADDQVLLSRKGTSVYGTAPKTIAGQLEVRGIGLLKVASASSVRVLVVVDLVPRQDVPRLPEAAVISLLGCTIPAFRLHAFDASTPEKIALLLSRDNFGPMH
jgi:HPr kinase/phosphorylase